MSEQEEDTKQYNVVVNDEEQYSIWFAERELPLGWRIVQIPSDWHEAYIEGLSEAEKERVGNKQECLAYIEEIWTDMRPLSLRKKMAEDAQ